MSTTIKIHEIAQRLLTPNDILDPRVFDTHGRMYPDLRKILLSTADFVIKNIFYGMQGIICKDIFLTGSSADFFYHDASDIDVSLDIHNNHFPYLTTDADLLEQYMEAMMVGLFRNSKFYAGKRSIDVSFGIPKAEFMGLYSIMQDKWIIEPRKDIVAGLDIDDIMEEYTNRYYQIKDYMRAMVAEGKTKTLEDIENLERYYKNCITTRNSSVREYIIYKLLNYRGVHKELKLLFNNSLKDYLSFNGATENEGTVQPLIETSLSPAGFSYPQPLSYKLKP